MSNHWFKFKQFVIQQDRCAMKVGTDSVLLGAWCEVDKDIEGNEIVHGKALDIGSGTGILALMIAQRNRGLMIDGVDIDHNSVEQAQENVTQSKFAEQITLKEQDFLSAEFEQKYDFIVTNPPFYQEKVFCPDENRNNARHTESLPFDSMIGKVATLLEPNGIFSVIIPSSAADKFIGYCNECGLHLCKRTDVVTNRKMEAKRSLIAFAHKACNPMIDTLCIRNEDNKYSEQFSSLTKEFYL